MKLKYLEKGISTLGRWTAVALLCISALAFGWQSPFFSNTAAIAAPNAPVIATSDAGDQIQRDNKSFVRDAAEKVKDAANSNANRVERATGNDGSFIERKAQRDAARVQKRANEDAARTQKAIDDNVNAVERTVDNIKDAFSR